MRERLRRYFPYAMALTLGLLASTGFSYSLAYFWTGVAFVGLFTLLSREQSALESALLGFFFGLSYFAFGLRWVLPALNLHGGLALPLALLVLFALSAVLALFPAAAGFVGAQVPGTKTAKTAWVFPLMWVLFEFLRAEWLCSFGWLTVGYAFTGSLLASYAPLLGAYGVSSVVLLVAGAIAAVLSQRGDRNERLLAGWICAALVLGAYGLEGVHWSNPGKRLQVRLVQPDLAVTTRPNLKAQRLALERVHSMSVASPMGRSLDLILWPESVYQFVLTRLPKAYTEVPIQVARVQGCPVFFNAFSEPQSHQFFNSIFLAQERGARSVYAKRHLVPFGEYVPWGFRWFVDALGIPMVDQSRGARPDKTIVVAGSRVALGVCYENLFAGELRDWFSNDSPEWIAFCVNLGWFSPEVARQFTAVSVMRAKETARPVLQVANNAMSASIGPDGIVERQVGSGAQTMDMVLQTAGGPPTPFMQMGFAMVALFWLVLFATVFLLKRALQRICSKKSILNG